MLDELKFRLFGLKSAAALDDTIYHEASWLLENNIITLKAAGRSITEVDVDIKNMSTRKLKVLLPLGAYFPANGQHQNMVNIREVAFRLRPNGSKFITVSVACLNAHLAIPNTKNTFRGVAQSDEQIVRFLKATDREHSMTVQAGIWAITDGLNREQIKQRLLNENRQLAGSQQTPTHAITDGNVDTARLILAQLSITTQLS